MIEIYAIRNSRLPEKEELINKIVIDVKDKLRVWKRMRNADAVESMAGIWLLQKALEKHEIDPTGLVLGKEENGKPELDLPQFNFSITHTSEWTACAVEGGEHLSGIGLDVESIKGKSKEFMDRIVRRWFSESEKSFFMKNPTEDTFLRIWTAKEATVKRSGEGLRSIGNTDIFAIYGERTEKVMIYPIPDAILSLCHGIDADPPKDVMFLNYPEGECIEEDA